MPWKMYVEAMGSAMVLVAVQFTATAEPAPPDVTQRAAQADREVLCRVEYKVADLVHTSTFPLVVPLRSSGPVRNAEPSTRDDFDPLIDLITSTIEPDTWDSVGGRGSISPQEANHSIVVVQTQGEHEEIRDLLAYLRKLNTLQVSVNVWFLSVSDGKMLAEIDSKKRVTVLSPQQADPFVVAARRQKNVDFAVRHITLLTGQQAMISLPFGERMALVPVSAQFIVSNDRKYVRVAAACDVWYTQSYHADFMAPTPQYSGPDLSMVSELVADGATLVIDMTPGTINQTQESNSDPSDTEPAKIRNLMFFTPQITVLPEGQKRLDGGSRDGSGEVKMSSHRGHRWRSRLPRQ